MLRSIRIEDELYHKYLDIVKVTDIGENTIKADTKREGILEFNDFDFGRVLYFKEVHKKKNFKTYEEYFEYCQNENLKIQEIKIRLENNAFQLSEEKKEREHVLKTEKEEQEKKWEKEKGLRKIQQKEREDRLTLRENRAIEMDNKRTLERGIISTETNINTLLNTSISSIDYLLKIKKGEEIQIRRILKQRGINYLIHFTRIENLSSILTAGLVPINEHFKMNIDPKRNDEKRLDGRPDCTSISIEFPNHKLFKSFRDYKYPDSRWAIIVLNTELLLSNDNIAYYFYTNAANLVSRKRALDELCTANSLEEMFYDTINIEEGKMIERSDLNIGDHLTTDPQAEILISGVIHPEFIDRVYFKNPFDKDNYIRRYGDALLREFDYGYEPNFFTYRRNFKLR